jgi:hypothetical protein
MASHITEPLATVDAKLFAVILLFSGQRSLLAIVGISPLGHGETNATREKLVRTASVSGIYFRSQSLPGSANCGPMHRSKQRVHSITSLAVICMISGTVRPSALAVLRLITNSYLVGACTGKSAGFSPLRMRSTYEADRRTMSLVSGP